MTACPTRRRMRRPAVVLACLAGMIVTTAVALAAAPTVIFGTSGDDVVDLSQRTGAFHVYALRGSDTIRGGAHSPDGIDYLSGDGDCVAAPENDDSYCEKSAPWDRQDWTDAVDQQDTITGGTGPSILVGGGGTNVLEGGSSYDLISAGPHANAITAGGLGSLVLEEARTATSTVTLQATAGRTVGRLKGVPNEVDVLNGHGGDTVRCASASNGDYVVADPADRVIGCDPRRVFRRWAHPRAGDASAVVRLPLAAPLRRLLMRASTRKRI